jgi:hypothetical protein
VGEDRHRGIRRGKIHVHGHRSLKGSSPTKERKEPDDQFKALVVATILDSSPERALDMLCEYYRVERPRLRVGVVSGRNKGVQAVYVSTRKEIIAARREFLYDPFTMLHEFYHHLRYFAGDHRGTEKYADRFAIDFIRAYQAVAVRAPGRVQE